MSLAVERLIKRFTKIVDDRIRQSSTPTHHQGFVVDSDPDAGIATLVVGTADRGTEVQVQAQSGFLPSVGSRVMLSMNGAEPLAFAPQHMVDGDMQSKEFVADLSGWRITATGDAEFNQVTVRGQVIGSSFTTRSLTNGRRIAIIPSDDPGTPDMILFSTGDPDEDQPAQLFSEIGGVGDPVQFYTLGLLANVWTGGLSRTRPAVRLINTNAPDFAVSVDEGILLQGYNIRMQADDTIMVGNIDGVGGGTPYISGLKVNQPPLAWDSRTSSQSIANGGGYATLGGRTTQKITAAGSSGHSAYGMSLVSGTRWIAGRTGLYRLTMRAAWDLNATGIRNIRLVNDTTATQVKLLDSKNAVGGVISHNTVDYFNVTGGHQFSLGASQTSGAALNLTSHEWIWEWVSD